MRAGKLSVDLTAYRCYFLYLPQVTCLHTSSGHQSKTTPARINSKGQQ